jgi:RNA polymerase sigma factor (sigma-70 family)
MSSTFVDDPRDRAFERLYERYVREVYRYVLAVLRNPSEAEDVTQTTFLNAYRAIQAGAEPQRPHNWLIAIAHNACRSRVRFVVRRPREIPLDDLVEQLVVPDSERLNIRELIRALGRLPFNQRAALTMREFEGRSYPEIAETLGVTVPAVEALLARARKALRLQAAALRGFALIQLPRSLRKLFESGDTAGSAIGAGAVAKAAAVLVAGAVAAGVGSTPSVTAQTPQRTAMPRVELRVYATSPPAARPRRPAAQNVKQERFATPRATVASRPSPDSTGVAGAVEPAAALDAPAQNPPSPATAAVAASLPDAPPPPLELPPLELTPLPDPPALLATLDPPALPLP